MKDIVDNLCKLYFTKLEAQIYVTLIKEGALSGYQIAKKINISRSSVYSALEPMYEKGMVLCLSEGTQIYSAQNPVTLFRKLKREYSENANKAEEVLKKYFSQDFEEKLVNLKGYETVVENAREVLRSAEKEVLINSDFNIQLFKDDILELRKKGVRIILFSFPNLNCQNLDIEYFTRNEKYCKDNLGTRIMLVADCKLTLVADTYKERGTWLGTLTNNTLITSIVSEHILHDIYILKTEEKYGDFINKSESLNTLIELR